MGLAEDVRANCSGIPATHKMPWIKEQLGAEAAELDALIADPSVRPSAIGKALRARGFDITDESIAAKCRKARECP